MDAAGSSTTGAVLQLHATRHCNLSCTHCYSSSGPEHKGGLPEALVAGVIEDAAAEGYGILSVSGGEPLMDPAFFRHAARARGVGMAVNLVSNGTLIRPRLAERLAREVDLVGVSVDGPPAAHNLLRGSETAFAATERGLVALRAAGARFAIIHTVRPESLKHLRWMVEFAREMGAAALQLHPLERAGRAAGAPRPGGEEADLPTRLMLLAPGLRAAAGDMTLHVDVLELEAVASWSFGAGAAAPLARIIDPLVLEPDGTLAPFTFGAPRSLAIGDLRRETLAAAAARYRSLGGPQRAAAYLSTVRDRLVARHPWPFVNWHEHLAGAAEPTATRGPRAGSAMSPEQAFGRVL